jgi:hypothetical protein
MRYRLGHHQELVWMLRFNSPAIEPVARKVLEIEGDDEICTTLDSSGENVTIIGVGQFQHIDERLETRHQCIARVHIHEIACSLELGARQVRPLLKNRRDPLPMNRSDQLAR